jgi:hypothetical protein
MPRRLRQVERWRSKRALFDHELHLVLFPHKEWHVGKTGSRRILEAQTGLGPKGSREPLRGFKK